MKDKLTMLMILDGFGDNPNKDGNAIKLAKTPNIDKLMKKYSNVEYQYKWISSRITRRTNGKLRSRAYKYWSRKNSLPRVNKNYKIN